MLTTKMNRREAVTLAGSALLLSVMGERIAKAADSPDVIYVNGKIITANSQNGIAEAIAIAGDKIQAVGQNDVIRQQQDRRQKSLTLAEKQ
jgi:adenine deaminase